MASSCGPLSRLTKKQTMIAAGLALLLLLVICISIGVPLAAASKSSRSADSLETAKVILKTHALIDGHNDLPYRIRIYTGVNKTDFNSSLDKVWEVSQTDIPRLKEGMVGAQFWAAYVPCDTQFKDAVTKSLEQVDIIRNLVAKYPEIFEFVTTSQGIRDAFKAKKIASLIGLEGGHSIDSSLGTLRMFYELGVRYMTVTHSCNTPWADNWLVDVNKTNEHDGLTDFGKKVIHEMNRLGMLVDLSHVAVRTMEDALDESKAPVIFSHTSAYALCNHYRNAPDKILKKTKQNRGVVMVNFYSDYINCYPTNQTNATLSQVADHIDHIKNVAGVETVGIGGDYDGVERLPVGLEDVSKYPDLFAELVKRGWSNDDLAKLAGENLLRVFKAAEEVRDNMKDEAPSEARIPDSERGNSSCHKKF
ncbi:dipeptidase 1 [Octopus vulgaris]|uniref:Dipeptidase n=1 Tax=Octopus vulgaris TaxID=6645 RepID=A0AA36AG90_OCTVU|nr:dipeptidase 1 [Octopus vulgaris]